jgi:hypothetical protein
MAGGVPQGLQYPLKTCWYAYKDIHINPLVRDTEPGSLLFDVWHSLETRPRRAKISPIGERYRWEVDGLPWAQPSVQECKFCGGTFRRIVLSKMAFSAAYWGQFQGCQRLCHDGQRIRYLYVSMRLPTGIAIAHNLYRTMANINVCAEIELLKVKVPLICLGTEGVSPHREGRYTDQGGYMDGMAQIFGVAVPTPYDNWNCSLPSCGHSRELRAPLPALR